jgi:hypothetical protein
MLFFNSLNALIRFQSFESSYSLNRMLLRQIFDLSQSITIGPTQVRGVRRC